ncbi:MAG: hypothetical protein GZ091_18105 [Paludibacter sp.]|nr:hypothetical protein [Paludibacter sp.]
MDLNISKITSDILTKVNRQPIFIKPVLPAHFEAQPMYKLFKSCYAELNGVEFIENEESKTFVYTLIYYFQNNEKFFNSPLLFSLTETQNSLSKGLLIVGGFGTGKSSSLKTIQYMLNIKFDSGVQLKFQTAIDIVSDFENTQQEGISDFYNKYSKGFRVFDDLKGEKIASRFGKSELFQDILFKRFENDRIITIILCNYADDSPRNIEAAIDEFNRYSGRILDRIYGKFNIVELKGKSFRK